MPNRCGQFGAKNATNLSRDITTKLKFSPEALTRFINFCRSSGEVAMRTTSSNKVHISCLCFGVDKFRQFLSFRFLAYRTIIGNYMPLVTSLCGHLTRPVSRLSGPSLCDSHCSATASLTVWSCPVCPVMFYGDPNTSIVEVYTVCWTLSTAGVGCRRWPSTSSAPNRSSRSLLSNHTANSWASCWSSAVYQLLASCRTARWNDLERSVEQPPPDHIALSSFDNSRPSSSASRRSWRGRRIGLSAWTTNAGVLLRHCTTALMKHLLRSLTIPTVPGTRQSVSSQSTDDDEDIGVVDASRLSGNVAVPVRYPAVLPNPESSAADVVDPGDGCFQAAAAAAAVENLATICSAIWRPRDIRRPAVSSFRRGLLLTCFADFNRPTLVSPGRPLTRPTTTLDRSVIPCCRALYCQWNSNSQYEAFRSILDVGYAYNYAAKTIRFLVIRCRSLSQRSLRCAGLRALTQASRCKPSATTAKAGTTEWRSRQWAMNGRRRVGLPYACHRTTDNTWHESPTT